MCESIAYNFFRFQNLGFNKYMSIAELAWQYFCAMTHSKKFRRFNRRRGVKFPNHPLGRLKVQICLFDNDTATTISSVKTVQLHGVTGADLGFGKGGCPIHQKGAPRRKARWRCALPGVSRANPENWKFRTLRCIFPAFRGTTTYVYDWVRFYGILQAILSLYNRKWQ